MKTKIFKGKLKPTTYHVGNSNQPNEYKDKFGTLYPGEVRTCRSFTRWGSLGNIPFKWIGKKVEIIVREIK